MFFNYYKWLKWRDTEKENRISHNVYNDIIYNKGHHDPLHPLVGFDRVCPDDDGHYPICPYIPRDSSGEQHSPNGPVVSRLNKTHTFDFENNWFLRLDFKYWTPN